MIKYATILLKILLLLIGLCQLTQAQGLNQVKEIKGLLNNSTMTLAGKISFSTFGLVYYDSIAPNAANNSLYSYDLSKQQKTRINESYFASSFADIFGDSKQRYIIVAEQIPDWSFRTVRLVIYNRVDMSYITYAYTTLQMETILDMAVYFDVDANNQTLKNQFKIGVVTNKGNICTWTFNFVTKTATDKLCVAAHALNASCIVSVVGRQEFVTGGADSAIRLWQNGKAVFSWLQTKPIVTLFIAKNDILWNGDSVGTIRSYNLTSRNPFKTTNLTEHKGKIHSLSTSNDSKYLVSCGDDGYVMLWNTQTGKLLQKVHFEKQNTTIKASFFITNSKFSTDNTQANLESDEQNEVDPKEYVYTAHLDGSVKIWTVGNAVQNEGPFINLQDATRITDKAKEFIFTLAKQIFQHKIPNI